MSVKQEWPCGFVLPGLQFLSLHSFVSALAQGAADD